jgi:hypothetical protein
MFLAIIAVALAAQQSSGRAENHITFDEIGSATLPVRIAVTGAAADRNRLVPWDSATAVFVVVQNSIAKAHQLGSGRRILSISPSADGLRILMRDQMTLFRYDGTVITECTFPSIPSSVRVIATPKDGRSTQSCLHHIRSRLCPAA